VSSIKNAARWFNLDAQRNQPVYIEVLCEAADLQDRLANVTEVYGVPVYSSGGQGGIKGNRKMGERARRREVPTVVLQVGDRDPHGEDIYTATAEDSVAWAEEGHVHPPGAPLTDLSDGDLAGLSFYRLALSPEQATDLDILDDEDKAEADAIPVPVLDRWLVEAIEALQDSACRTELKAEEESERERLPGIIRAALDEAARP
jgi:hypothetical protein